MGPWEAPAAAASMLLVVTGATKVVRPAASAAAIPLTASPRLAFALSRVLGLAEIVVGLGVLVVGNRLTDAVMAAMFAGFAVVAYTALRASAPTCGCTGRDDSPPAAAHVVMNVAFAALGAAAAATAGGPTAGPLLEAAGHPLGAATFATTVAVVWLAWLVLGLGTVMPAPRRHS
ncbi:MAG TPA: MauE/DoxX family redox-associated membrane protein [Mycobacteriales bacterium]|jgi:hypothetical protein|nr:MauE/DoxX family redox-associated membrane protein [Mycobacteriales bacterium]